MNRLVDFFKNLKFPKMGRPSIRQIIFWIAALALAVGLYIFMNGFVTCWQFTALDGTPPANCNGGSTGLSSTPIVNAEGTSLGPATPTAEVSAPAVQAPTWD